MVEVIQTYYINRGNDGDFETMINSQVYKDSLFVFADNEEDHFSYKIGYGDAVIRPFNRFGKGIPQSAGIPLGSLKHGGYTVLNKRTKLAIDCSINEIKRILDTFIYDKILFNVNQETKLFNCRIFTISNEVAKYVTDELIKLNNYE